MCARTVCMVTGCAGFIGSHLCERLLNDGYSVIGVDAFIEYYPREIKERNMAAFRQRDGFVFVEGELGALDLSSLLVGVGYVFHQAGMPGVRASWGQRFRMYTELNILATQQLLEACLACSTLQRIVVASSSSVYGDSQALPLRESSTPAPVSPYGLSKLASELLARLYAANYGLPTVSLRYFTAYGPRQRPDMAFHKFLRAIYAGEPIPIYGDGEQTRDFTYVSDIVDANLLAMRGGKPGDYYNIGGGSRVTVNQCIEALGRVTGREPRIERLPSQPGDVRHTWADISAARERLGYGPRVGLEEGLSAENSWYRTAVLGHRAE